jgi:hypothetical protein
VISLYPVKKFPAFKGYTVWVVYKILLVNNLAQNRPAGFRQFTAKGGTNDPEARHRRFCAAPGEGLNRSSSWAPLPLGAGRQRSAPLEPVVLSFGGVGHCNPRGTRIAGHG